jgi:outer membrane protein OmpA-like peptidoglycan-associated protein
MIISVRTINDRPLGSSNFLYLNLASTRQNRRVVDRLARRISRRAPEVNALRNFVSANTQGNTGGNSMDMLTDFQGNPISLADNMGNLVFGVAFIRANFCNRDRATLDDINNDISNPMTSATKGVFVEESLDPDNIYFADESRAYDPSLDNDNNGTTNGQDLALAEQKLLNDPDRIAIVTGHTSMEDRPGGTTNMRISNDRASVVFNLLSQFLRSKGIDPSNQLTNQGGIGAVGADPAPVQNQDGVPSINRKASIRYDIPLQTQ